MALHSLVIAYILAPNASSKQNKPKSTFDADIAPNAKKLVWYRFAPKQLPEVSPVKSTGDSKPPKGAVLSAQSIVAKPPKANPGKQVILQQAPTIKLQQEIKAPNMIAFSPVPAPPPLERPKPKAFVPPPARQETPRTTRLINEAAPQLDSNTSSVMKDTGVIGGLARPKRLVKTFVAPSPAPARANRNSDTGTGLDAASAPAIPGGTTPETLSAAIIGLNAARTLEKMPQGSLEAQFSTGPNIGPPSSGAGGDGSGGPGGKGGLRFPDLSVRGGDKKGPGSGENGAGDAKSGGKVEYRQTVLQYGRATLSAPLRPSSRMIPPALEARFRGRNVYTMVIPMPKLAQYSGDWIVWFAEREPKPGEAPQIYAPAPSRKIDAVKEAGGTSLEGRVQLGAIVGKDGHLESIAIVKTFDARINQSAIEDLKKWEFTPASQAGAPVETEVVIEIPFRLTVE